MKFMTLNRPILLLGLLLGLSGCGGGGGGIEAAGSPSADLRLASADATVKPWGSESTVTTDTQALVPVKSPAPTASPAANAAPTVASSGTVAPYDPQALPVIGGEISASATWPAWRRSMSRWEWRQIPGTDLSIVAPNPSVPGALSARIDAWNGLAADVRANRLFSAGNGGHADYSGNEVYEVDLSVDTPQWRMLIAPSSTDDILASNVTKGIYNDYYRDGRPASTHTYYALQFLASRNAIFKFGAGSLWGTGNESNWKTDAFSLNNNDWQPAGTWPDVSDTRNGVIASSTCMNPATEEVYVAAPVQLRRFDPTSGTFTRLAAWPDNSSAVYARGCAFDTARNRVVYFGDAYRVPTGGLVYDVKSNAFSRIVFTGDTAVDITKANYHFAWYEPKIGKFLVKTTVGDRVYAVDPETFAVSPVGTAGGSSLPDAANGVQTRWQRLPKLGGYAYYPRYGSGIWFLAIE